jgi:hypothetical protein
MIHSQVLDNTHAKLYVITSISNPARYKSRYNLYRNFEKMVNDAGGVLYTIEMAFGNRQLEITSKDESRDIQVRSSSEIWHKENLLNVAMAHLPRDWEYVAWIDADVVFSRPDWVDETLHLLQHYSIIQMFSFSQDLDPNYEPVGIHKGFVYSFQNGLPSGEGNGYYGYPSWHPGFAWAATRKTINDLGGLVDWAILGAADRHMAFALIDKVEQSIPPDLNNSPYQQDLLIWQDRANKYIKKNIGYMPGLLLHQWHGKKKDRQYHDRWKILVNNNFNPDLDLKKDSQGLWQLTDRNPKLRDDLRRYFRERNEDSIDL